MSTSDATPSPEGAAPKARLSIADVETALDECVRLSPDDRLAYLEREWGSRPEIVAEVRSLLGYLPDPECFEDLPPAIDEDLARVGSTVGAFQLESLIGRGSTGAVYRAQQASPARRVAVKLLRRDYSGPSALRRFKREGELLGRLSHPAIARIYAMGVEQSGGHSDPYIAMELIDDARTIEVWWRSNAAPPLKERLQVFATLCDGVHHAHLRGVVHRDLKPANVLFGRDQTPRLVDFSIARTTGEGVRDETLATRVGAIVGTLSYMSPEQVSGAVDKIDARTDVYALGALLYELLAGKRACDVDQLPLHEAARIICEVGPKALSSHGRALRGDLETIVEKAMAKEPDARYESAAALAADVRRFINDEAILARPPSRVAAALRFVRKHRVGVAVFALFLTALGVGYSSSVAANKRTARALYLASLARTELLAELGESVAAAEMLARTPEADWTWVHRALERTLDGRAIAQEGPLGSTTRALAIAPALHAVVCSLDSRVQFVNLADLSTFGEVQLRSPVIALALRVDAKLAFAGCVDGSVWEIDTAVRDTPRLPRLLGELASPCTSIALSPNGLELLVGTTLSGVEMFDLLASAHHGMPMPASLRESVGGIPSIAWEPGGDSALFVSTSLGILRWSSQRRETELFFENQAEIASVAWSPDGKRFAFAAEMEVFLGDVAARTAERITSRRQPVSAIAFSPDGRTLASVGTAAHVCIFELDGTPIATRFSPEGEQSSVFWVDADTVITAGTGIATWELVEPFPRVVLPSRDDGTRGKSSARWLTPHRIRFIDEHGVAMDCSMISPPQRPNRVAEIEVGCATAQSLDGRRGAIALPTGGIAFIEPSGKLSPCISEGRFVDLVFSPDGSRIAATDRDGAVWILSLANCDVVARWTPRAKEAALGAIWTGMNALLTTSAHFNMHLVLPKGPSEEWAVTRAGFSGRTHIGRGSHGTYYLTNANATIEAVLFDGTFLHQFAGGLGGSLAIAESPNGMLLATAGRDGRVHLFESATQDELASFPTVADAVIMLEWSPDGTALLVTGDEGSLEVIDSKPLRKRYAERLIWIE
ncbi:MAG: hypothetical protein EXS10_06920 [Phycisphaerales bacterium]|nr:hypothetical protein [Phycisphaerales bacterium]